MVEEDFKESINIIIPRTACGGTSFATGPRLRLRADSVWNATDLVDLTFYNIADFQPKSGLAETANTRGSAGENQIPCLEGKEWTAPLNEFFGLEHQLPSGGILHSDACDVVSTSRGIKH